MNLNPTPKPLQPEALTHSVRSFGAVGSVGWGSSGIDRGHLVSVYLQIARRMP